MIAQVQREGEFLARGGRLDTDVTRRMADPEKSGQAPTFSLERIHRKGFMAAAARMDHVISTSAFRSLHPGVDYIECQRGVNTDCRMQCGPRLPGSVANTGDELPFAARRPQRDGAAVTSHHMAIGRKTAHLDLDAFHR